MRLIFATLFFLSLTSNVYAELTPLKEHLRNNYDWEKSPSELGYVCTRCGVLLYLINVYSENNVDKKTTEELKIRSEVYLQFGEMVSQVNGIKNKAFLERVESITTLYGNDMIQNKKINNNVFTGYIGDDLEICAENFEKVANIIEKIANNAEGNSF